jgi:uncharacterized protein YndB with AHSA1/START domain
MKFRVICSLILLALFNPYISLSLHRIDLKHLPRNSPSKIESEVCVTSSSDDNFSLTWTSRWQFAPMPLENGASAIGDHVVLNATFSQGPLLPLIVRCSINLTDVATGRRAFANNSGNQMVLDTYYLFGTNVTVSAAVEGITDTNETILHSFSNLSLCNFFSPVIKLQPSHEISNYIFNISWSATDLNGDDINLFMVWISQDGGASFLLLAQNLSKPSFIWDSHGFLSRDYYYRVRGFSIDTTFYDELTVLVVENYWPGDYTDAIGIILAGDIAVTPPPPLIIQNVYISSPVDVTFYESDSLRIITWELIFSDYDIKPPQFTYSIHCDDVQVATQIWRSSNSESITFDARNLSLGNYNITLSYWNPGYDGGFYSDSVIVSILSPAPPLLYYGIVVASILMPAVALLVVFSTYIRRHKFLESKIVDDMIIKDIIVPASISEIWTAWTTNEGVTSFFAPSSNIELVVGGAYEIFFDPDAPPGQRGAEGVKILDIQPRVMLSFEWLNPPSIPAIRNEKTRVVIRFEKMSPDATLVRLEHSGWRTGHNWKQALQYFEQAWDVVLDRLVTRFTEGPIQWDVDQ